MTNIETIKCSVEVEIPGLFHQTITQRCELDNGHDGYHRHIIVKEETAYVGHSLKVQEVTRIQIEWAVAERVSYMPDASDVSEESE